MAKRQLCTCITLFSVFLNHRYTIATWNCLSEWKCVKSGVRERNPKFFFRNGPFRFKPRKFANIWQIKWNLLRSVTFETVRIHFLTDVFGLLSYRNFATMTTWHNDFSSLLRKDVPARRLGEPCLTLPVTRSERVFVSDTSPSALDNYWILALYK